MHGKCCWGEWVWVLNLSRELKSVSQRMHFQVGSDIVAAGLEFTLLSRRCIDCASSYLNTRLQGERKAVGKAKTKAIKQLEQRERRVRRVMTDSIKLPEVIVPSSRKETWIVWSIQGWRAGQCLRSSSTYCSLLIRHQRPTLISTGQHQTMFNKGKSQPASRVSNLKSPRWEVMILETRGI